MVPDTSAWRDTQAYAYFDDLALDGLAWECLRRNPDYQRDMRQAATQVATGETPASITQTWGLRFRHQTQPLSHFGGHLLVARGQ